MTLKVRILPRAKTDFRSIFSYIEKHSEAGASRWRDAFLAATDRAASNPEQFALAPEDEQTRFTLRQLLFKTPHGLQYRAVFTVLDGEVLILRIRGAGQPALAADEMPLG
ncbi:type II toxin-antitoxin system RelE/ParE family toxin [Crateriforma conspicua]|uniref:type II toxin-antitoxin system RelE/ParE family toxin n=1 Tax=Crateriforma conspicua TaxID=2527996 RepID=UPI0011B4A9A3|nr:type II toxin-antitoxin system RelE/ParE family toxin [Crateriforma conspicua]